MPLTPMPAVKDQHRVDREVLRYTRPPYIERDYSSREYRFVRVLSYPEWAVPCRVKGCGAEVGQPCKMSSGKGLHAKREADHEAHVRSLYREEYGTATHPPRPWYHRWILRTLQRTAVVAVEQAAANQSRQNSSVAYAKRFALDIGVDPAMVRRAVNAGHQRVRREEARSAGRSEMHYQNRVRSALAPVKSIQNEED